MQIAIIDLDAKIRVTDLLVHNYIDNNTYLFC